MNIYDFDGTIYNGDTTKDIIKYALKKYPLRVLKCLRKAQKLKKDYKIGLVTFEHLKEEMLSFLFTIENYPKFINEFVDSHMKKIKPWYLSRRTENDVIISASYELWISAFAKRLGVRGVIATRVDSEGKILGLNCKGQEKLNRLYAIIPNAQILTAYSDEKSDEYILASAQSAYVVEGNKLKPYFKGYKFKK